VPRRHVTNHLESGHPELGCAVVQSVFRDTTYTGLWVKPHRAISGMPMPMLALRYSYHTRLWKVHIIEFDLNFIARI